MQGMIVFNVVVGLMMIGMVNVLSATGAADQYAQARQVMVQRDLLGRDITDSQVLAAMGRVPRHLFVPPALEHQAYDDNPLPIGHGATVSQPYIVALMTQAAGIKPGRQVLEVGTGFGYQAAVLALLTDNVYSIELIPESAQSARDRLAPLGLRQVQVKSGDGWLAGIRPFRCHTLSPPPPRKFPRPSKINSKTGQTGHPRRSNLWSPVSPAPHQHAAIPFSRSGSPRSLSCPGQAEIIPMVPKSWKHI